MGAEKPDYLKKEHLNYLDALRENGIVNMYGAGPYLAMEYPDLLPQEAIKVVMYWMKTFKERHK